MRIGLLIAFKFVALTDLLLIQVRIAARYVPCVYQEKMRKLTSYSTEISKSPVSKVPPELAKHEASQHKVTREMIKRKREDDG